METTQPITQPLHSCQCHPRFSWGRRSHDPRRSVSSYTTPYYPRDPRSPTHPRQLFSLRPLSSVANSLLSGSMSGGNSVPRLQWVLWRWIVIRCARMGRRGKQSVCCIHGRIRYLIRGARSSPQRPYRKKIVKKSRQSRWRRAHLERRQGSQIFRPRLFLLKVRNDVCNLPVDASVHEL